MDANDDGILDASLLDEVEIDPATGLTDEGLTPAQTYPNLAKAKAARASIAPHLTEEVKAAYIYRMAADGRSLTQWAGAIPDNNDIESRGFEAEIILNPTRNWRIAFSGASQETVLTNIAPALTKLLDGV